MMAKNMDRLTKNFTASLHPTMGATQLICRREAVSAYIAIVTLSNVLSQILSAITTSDPAYRYRSGNINIFTVSPTLSVFFVKLRGLVLSPLPHGRFGGACT